jgi:hypothetical protein
MWPFSETNAAAMDAPDAVLREGGGARSRQ